MVLTASTMVVSGRTVITCGVMIWCARIDGLRGGYSLGAPVSARKVLTFAESNADRTKKAWEPGLPLAVDQYSPKMSDATGLAGGYIRRSGLLQRLGNRIVNAIEPDELQFVAGALR